MADSFYTFEAGTADDKNLIAVQTADLASLTRYAGTFNRAAKEGRKIIPDTLKTHASVSEMDAYVRDYRKANRKSEDATPDELKANAAKIFGKVESTLVTPPPDEAEDE